METYCRNRLVTYICLLACALFKCTQTEWCEGYTDSFGDWHDGISCPDTLDSSEETYCCRSEYRNYCCDEGHYDHDIYNSDDSSTVSQTSGIVSSVVVLALIAIIVVVCVVCIRRRCRRFQGTTLSANQLQLTVQTTNPGHGQSSVTVVSGPGYPQQQAPPPQPGGYPQPQPVGYPQPGAYPQPHQAPAGYPQVSGYPPVSVYPPSVPPARPPAAAPYPAPPSGAVYPAQAPPTGYQPGAPNMQAGYIPPPMLAPPPYPGLSEPVNAPLQTKPSALDTKDPSAPLLPPSAPPME